MDGNWPEMSFTADRRSERSGSDRAFDRPIPNRPSTVETSSSLQSKSSSATDRDDGATDPRGSLGLNLLHSPSQPAIDFIFVHGLGGGSRKTWSKTTSMKHFWPQEWLPKDPAFQDVRIYSYGYDSDWARGKENILNIHHIGKSFLGELETTPHLCTSKTPIVFIGHSMGGLVIKQAYMLLKQSGESSTMSGRFNSIFFLGTPHRGSSSAKLLKNILQMTYSHRAYVADLEKGSDAIQSINNEFRQYSMDLSLWSFYETQKLSLGLFNTLIVDPESAVLGYPQEKQMPMNADHRSICKFETPSDPNFLIIRNSLAFSANSIRNLEAKVITTATPFEVENLRTYLKVSHDFQDDLVMAEDSRMDGTCDWLLEKQSFRNWRDSPSTTSRILWISGPPATGKSILAGYVVDQLRKADCNCSFFFFKHGDKFNEDARRMVLSMSDEKRDFHRDNERLMWRTLFSSGIFQAGIARTYWIIDALDECVNFSPFLDTMISKLDSAVPLRILITSRETPEIGQLLGGLSMPDVLAEKISVADTASDIYRLVDSKAKTFLARSEDDRRALVNKIVSKSKGSFLWTTLVLRELSNTYTEEGVAQVLEEVPRGMNQLYSRTLAFMAQMPRSKPLATAILTWVACSARPLTTTELEGALSLDVPGAYTNLKDTILALCGQMVVVDKFDKVQMIHETAREFLFNKDMVSEFSIEKKAAHARIAKVCLTYLASEELKPPRMPRRTKAPHKRMDFAVYACIAFSYHLAHSDPQNGDVLRLLDRFLGLNVLSWIEFIAQGGNLNPLVSAAKHFQVYYNEASAERSPLGKDMRTVKSWQTDLVRISARFSEAILASPISIFFTILPFCPSESAIRKTSFASRKLSLHGHSETQWDDRLTCIDYSGYQTTAVGNGEGVFAVGLSDGAIKLYHAMSCQELRSLQHGEAVKLLTFKPKSNLLASCGSRQIRLWNTSTGENLRSLSVPHRIIGIIFDAERLLAASCKSYLTTWILEDNEAEPSIVSWARSSEGSKPRAQQPPNAISISTEHGLLAIAHSGHPVILWDIESESLYGTCGKRLPNGETSTHRVTSLVLNANPGLELLAISYLDGDLVIMDPFSDLEIESVRAECHTLAGSPDGRFLAGAAGHGTIKIYEFETLKPVYSIRAANYFIKQIAFSHTSLQLIDIRGAQCNVWEPAALVRNSTTDDSSEGTLMSVSEADARPSHPRVESLAINPKDDVVFCGKADGIISVYSLKDGRLVKDLYKHKLQIRVLILWENQNVILSIDASNAILATKVSKSTDGKWAVKEVFSSRITSASPVTNLLHAELSAHFLAWSRESDHLWTIEGREIASRTHETRDIPRTWVNHAFDRSHVVCTDIQSVSIYRWENLAPIARVNLSSTPRHLQMKNAISLGTNNDWRLILELSELNGPATTEMLYLVDPSIVSTVPVAASNGSNQATAASIALGLQLSSLANQVSQVLGVIDTGKLLFLDIHSWICSINLTKLEDGVRSYSRHFFVPYDWFSGSRNVVCSLGKRDVVLTRNGEVAVIRNWMIFEEQVLLEL
ncbi:hypothetical protein PFICI_00454 [Pestalotiopsis fici W106-1]|uniref:Uncharacterized protein n=1 Tax=Pestalotiopsis fici (strain W106-1 / CGMCC3.15140) TaxID=1229662 RepID=W3XMV8_PESFW|nr:uncharacterized protein PFICI_00454 [Pestalotiopsis fici W106-1]ETS86626.1 hypothetical protein PFICI_00454 [Pestalotiopsis fici W106-1]